MKILYYSRVFHPSLGGMQTIARLLSEEFARAGHEVTLITPAPGPEDGYAFRIVRQPNLRDLMRWLQWSDVVLCNGMSLRGIWPAAMSGKPVVVTHQGWLASPGAPGGLRGLIKSWVSRKTINIWCSSAVASAHAAAGWTIPNPYEDQVFAKDDRVPRDRELVFVGRLVREKGVDVLLTALEHLKAAHLRPSLSVIGDGPEARALHEQVDRLGLGSQVRFVGPLHGRALAVELNRHRILVVPSTWREPFGIVALEGMACGCVIVGSDGGGLEEAIGPAGVTFANREAEALAAVLAQLLEQPDRIDDYRKRAAKHLAKHQSASVAQAYLDVLRSTVSRRPSGLSGDASG